MRLFYDSLPEWAQYTFWGITLIGGVLGAAIWLQNERDQSFDDGRWHAVRWQTIFDECEERNVAGWVAYYHRPAEAMSEVDLAGVAYTCDKYANKQLPR